MSCSLLLSSPHAQEAIVRLVGLALGAEVRRVVADGQEVLQVEVSNVPLRRRDVGGQRGAQLDLGTRRERSRP